MKDLSIVTIALDPERPIFERFLSSIRQYTTCDYELIVVDNAGSNAETSAFVAANCDRYLRLDARVSVAAAWNAGVAAAAGRFVLVTNDDVVVPRRWFTSMTDVFRAHPAAGMVVPVMNYSVPEQTHVGDISHLHEAEPVRLAPFRQFVWGAFMLFSREALARTHGFSEEYDVAGGEDLDMCFRLYESGCDIYVDHRVFVYHEWGSTGDRLLGDARRRELYEANYVLFKERWARYTRDWDQPARGRLGRWWDRLTARSRP